MKDIYQPSDLVAAIGVDFRTIDACVHEAARVVNAEPTELMDLHGPRAIARARQGAMWLAKGRGVKPYELAQYFGLDHTTITHGIRAAQERFDSHANR